MRPGQGPRIPAAPVGWGKRRQKAPPPGKKESLSLKTPRER